MNHPHLNLHPSGAYKTREEYQKAYENYEIEYWCNKFGVSSDILKQAIAAVGLSVAAVENHLKTNGMIS